MKPKTAAQINRPQTGEVWIDKKSNRMFICRKTPAADILKTLFDACGWHVTYVKNPPRKRRKK